MSNPTTVIRVFKKSRRILRTLSSLKNKDMIVILDELVTASGDEEKEKNPYLWDEFFSRADDDEK